MKNAITKFIDTFYFLFRRVMPIQTYRYAVCGGSNVVLDICLYFICFNFILQKENIDLHFVVLSAHIASLFIVFPITFTTGFLLNRFITFHESNLHWKVQIFRYFIVGMGSLLLSYISMKLLVDVLTFYPTPSRFITIIVTIVYSYLLQKKYSFR